MLISPSARKREKMLEREIAKLAGENWQVCDHFQLIF